MEYRTKGPASRPIVSPAIVESLEHRRLLSADPPMVDVQWGKQHGLAAEDQYVVVLRNGVDIDKIAQRQGFTDVKPLDMPGFYVFNSTRTTSQLRQWATGNQRVVGLTPDWSRTIQTVPNDSYFKDQWALNNREDVITPDPAFDPGNLNANFFGSQAGQASSDSMVRQAWDITRGNQQNVVAVIDTGVDLTHPDLVQNIWNNPNDTPGDGIDNDMNGFIDDVHGWNFADNNNDVTDLNGHGTHVSGIIGAKGNNAIGISGVDWDVSLMEVKVFGASGGATTSTIINGYQYVVDQKRRGVPIVAVNASLGGQNFPNDRVEFVALQRMGEQGIIFVAAAGNDSQFQQPFNNDINFTAPAKLSLTLPNLITVAALDNQDNLAFFSSVGPQSVQVGAPGVNILSTLPTYNVTINDETGAGTGYGYLSGTSQATPFVTGVVALMFAANPKATVQQIRQALFSSVDPVPSLLGTLSGPRYALTGGRVNAYKAVRGILEQFVKSDSVTQGNWLGGGGTQRLFGEEKAYVVGDSDQAFPEFPEFTLEGASRAIIQDSTTDPRALQTSDGSSRIAGAWLAGNAMDFNFNFTDDKVHRVTLYMCDFDKQGRQQNVEVFDPDTGEPLSGQFGQHLTNLTGGVYLQYELRGTVTIRVTNLVPGKNAIVNGLFIDPAVTDESTFERADTSTKGAWRTSYGTQGAYIVGESGSFPPIVNVIANNTQTNVLKRSTAKSATTTLERPSDPNHGVMAYLSSPSFMTFDMNFTDGAPHTVSLYMADYDKKGRAQRIEVLNPDGTVATSQEIANFVNGQYLTFNMQDHQVIRITRLAGQDAVVSGFFFDPPINARVRMIKQDAVTQGSWKAFYGSDASFVVGDQYITNPFDIQLGPIDNFEAVTVTINNGAGEIVKYSTKDVRALQKHAGVFDRIVARYASRSFIDIDLNFHDAKTHQVALYALDDKGGHRIQAVEAIDPTTGQVMNKTLVNNFQNGKYVVYDMAGHVTLRITRLQGLSAVFNGLFFD